MKPKKIFLVDDHNLFRKGISMIISEMDGVEITGEAENGEDFLRYLDVEIPDLVVMDIKMPIMGGEKASRLAIEKQPDLKILVLSMFGEVNYYNQMLDVGVKGFVLKNADPDELRNAIKAVLNNGTYFSQELLLNLVNTMQNEKTLPDVKLSKREIEVLEYLCKGFSSSEIAEKLFLSQRTIETHRANIMSKTNTKNSIQLVVYAIKNKICTI